MKLVRRLTLYLLLAVGCVFGVDTFLSVRSHLSLFYDDARRDEKVLGVALARAVERVWQRQGEAEALDLIGSLGRAFDHVSIRLVDLDAEPGDPEGPDARGHALEALRRDHALTHVRDEGEAGARLYTYVPLDLEPRDELSQLASEMNAMAAALDAAACKVARESAARLRAVEQLRHADRLTTVGKLAAGLAHELGTPLNVVAGRAKMIATGEIDSPEEGRDSARIIAEQAERMTRIVRQLLDFARRRSHEKHEVDLRTLVRQTRSLLEALAAKRGVTLGGEEPSQALCARVDAAQVQQALTNLVVNAIHASAPGSHVTLSLASHEKAPDERGEVQPGPWVALAVRDHGIGIPPERMREIFDPFFTTKPVGEGTGLGLSVALGIAQEHGGWIAVESTPGRGSCFTLWLPRGEA